MSEKKITTLEQLQMLASRAKAECGKLKEEIQAINVPTKVSQLANDKKFQTQEEVAAAIKAQVSSTYKAGGSVAFSALPALEADSAGVVVNVTDAFTTTASFVEGAGKRYGAGTNVVVVDAGSGTYKYDVLSGFVDLSGYQPKEAGKGLSTNDFTAADKSKLDSLSNYTHPTYGSQAAGLYKITVTGGHVSAASKVAKSDITALGIPEQDTKYSPASASDDGLMSSVDKAKLDGLSNYTHPTYDSQAAGLYKITVTGGHVSAVSKVDKSDITALGIPEQDTKYSPASASGDGLMSSVDKAKLDGMELAEDAEVTTMLEEVFGAAE